MVGVQRPLNLIVFFFNSFENFRFIAEVNYAACYIALCHFFCFN